MRLCLDCGVAIAPSRLQALPGASLCVGCSQKPYTRPNMPTFPSGNWKLLEDATESPMPRLADPERHAQERAEGSMYRVIERLDENEDLT